MRPSTGATMGFERQRLPDPVGYFEGQDLKLCGRGKWRTTSCVFHGGSDSMRIDTTSGGWCCMNCGAKGGDVLQYHMLAHRLEFIDAARQLGAWVESGNTDMTPPSAPISARAALYLLASEATLAAVAAGNVAHGVVLTDRDKDRLMIAAGRISRILEIYR